MKICGRFDFSARMRNALPMLVSESYVNLSCDITHLQKWAWYGLQKTGWYNRQDNQDEVVLLDKGIFIEFGEEFIKRETPLAGYSEFAYFSDGIIGVIDGDNYAFYDLEKNTPLFEGEDDDGVDDLCFYSPDVHIYKEYKRLVARNNQGEKLWELKLEEGRRFGIIQRFVAIPEAGVLFVYFDDSEPDDLRRLIVTIDSKTGQVLRETRVGNRVYRDGFFQSGDAVTVIDDRYVWQLDAKNGEVIAKFECEFLKAGLSLAFTESTLSIICENGQLVILDKITLNHLHTLDLGQGQYHCHMTGNKAGVAVRLADKNSFNGNAYGYGLYLTDEQLVNGEMPDLTPEPLAASVEKTPAEGGYNLTVTLNPELTVADFLRHLSHALWQTAYEHCTLVDAIDSTNVRLGPPDFMGTLTLNLKNAPELTDEQEQAVDAIIEGAKRTMCGLGECIVQANTDVQSVLEIVVER